MVAPEQLKLLTSRLTVPGGNHIAFYDPAPKVKVSLPPHTVLVKGVTNLPRWKRVTHTPPPLLQGRKVKQFGGLILR